VSPYNNPALQALMYATLEGYRVGWPMGADKLLLVSLGTGARDLKTAPARVAAENALKSMLSLMDDCAELVETLLQWISTGRTARAIDRELGDLRHDLIGSTPLIHYLRFNVALTQDSLTGLGLKLDDEKVERLSAMDDPANMTTLQGIGAEAAKQQVCAEDFPANFDLTP